MLTKEMIITLMNERIVKDRLIITPLFDLSGLIDPVSIDVRLGNEFIIMKKESFPALDIRKEKELSAGIEKYQESVRLNFHEEFVLHPNQLIIGSTLEYVSIPSKVMCYVVGKSTWGRMGLIIATATKVDPGFKGCITFIRAFLLLNWFFMKPRARRNTKVDTIAQRVLSFQILVEILKLGSIGSQKINKPVSMSAKYLLFPVHRKCLDLIFISLSALMISLKIVSGVERSAIPDTI